MKSKDNIILNKILRHIEEPQELEIQIKAIK